MKQEMQLFDSTENQSPNIIKLCDALKTILLTSVEAERAFSAAGLFVTKLRTRLSDKNLETLIYPQRRFNFWKQFQHIRSVDRKPVRGRPRATTAIADYHWSLIARRNRGATASLSGA
ncbi:hypothetical protein TNCV_2152741 [Trichonephila clavipes]|nr:hypothetical protein TNCV_2152741 [Trichonephila clavipes]